MPRRKIAPNVPLSYCVALAASVTADSFERPHPKWFWGLLDSRPASWRRARKRRGTARRRSWRNINAGASEAFNPPIDTQHDTPSPHGSHGFFYAWDRERSGANSRPHTGREYRGAEALRNRL